MPAAIKSRWPTTIPKHQAGLFNSDDHADYLRHWGAFDDLVSLTHFQSGLGHEAAEQLRQVEIQHAATFRLHFTIEAKQTEGGLAEHASANTSDTVRLVKPLVDHVSS